MFSMYQMKSLDKIHRGLAHLLSTSLSDNGAESVQISLSYSTPSLYEQITKALFAHTSCLYAFEIEASAQNALLATLTPAASALLASSDTRFQPNIIREQFQPIANSILHTLETAWTPFNTKIGNANSITNFQALKLIPPDEIVAFFGFKIKIANQAEETLNPWGDPPHTQGLIFCYPISALDPILPTLESSARPNPDLIKTISPPNRHILAPIFKDHQRKPMTIHAVLESDIGESLADNDHSPNVVSLTYGQTTFLGGDHTHPIAPELIKQAPGWIVPESQYWIGLIIKLFGKRFDTRQRIRLSAQNLNLNHLKEISQHVPSGFEIKRIDLNLAQRIGNEVSPALVNTFSSIENFVKHGIGFCALTNDQIVCGASSAYTCKKGIAIQINTHPDFRRQGLAALVAAHLIVHCLEAGIQPYWEAANTASAKLAEKLGYVQEDVYNMLMPY